LPAAVMMAFLISTVAQEFHICKNPSMLANTGNFFTGGKSNGDRVGKPETEKTKIATKEHKEHIEKFFFCVLCVLSRPFN
jgi:hypothetical protein